MGQLEEGSERYNKLAAYWQEQLASPPALLQLPFDKPRPVRSVPAAAVPAAFYLDEQKTTALKRLAAAHGSSLYAVFLALYRWVTWPPSSGWRGS